MSTEQPAPDSAEEGEEVISANSSPGRVPRSRGEARRTQGSTEAEQFRLFQAFLRQQAASSSDRGGRRQNQSDDDQATDRNGGASGPPPEWSGPSGKESFEDWAIRARLWIATTRTKPIARGPLLLKALTGTPFESFKHLAKDRVWLSSPTNAEELIAKMDTPEQYGDDQEEHLLESLSRLTFHLKRTKNETWKEYMTRWEAAHRKVKEHQIDLPEPYLGFLMINGLKLDDHDIKAMLNFTRGDIAPASIRAWLRKNEAKLTVSHLGVDRDQKKTSAGSSVLLAEPFDDDDQEEDPEDAALEQFLADLQDPHGSHEHGTDSEGISEGEAAEILQTIVKDKKRTFTQSIKAKKAVEMSRGYGKYPEIKSFGKGKGKHSGKHYHLTVDGIRSLVRRYNCDQKGHIAKHCPQPRKERTKPEKEVSFLETSSTNAEAYFCGMTETVSGEPSSTSQVYSFSSRLCDNAADSADPDHEVRCNLRDYTDSTGCVFRDLFFFENYLRNSSGKSIHPDESCATLDTGCQRAAVGINTLRKLIEYIPDQLQVITRPVVNKFKSVHGISETKRVALAPCSLGPRGCFLNPAVFEEGFGVNAPFLLSLPFLMQTKSQLCLDQDRGLVLQMVTPRCSIPCHLGPTGALRIPLASFTSDMVAHLLRHTHDCTPQEFEVLTTGPDSSSTQVRNSHLAPFPTADLSDHGRGLQQACPRREALRSTSCVAEPHPQAPMAAEPGLDSIAGTYPEGQTTSRRRSVWDRHRLRRAVQHRQVLGKPWMDLRHQLPGIQRTWIQPGLRSCWKTARRRSTSATFREST